MLAMIILKHRRVAERSQSQTALAPAPPSCFATLFRSSNPLFTNSPKEQTASPVSVRRVANLTSEGGRGNLNERDQTQLPCSWVAEEALMSSFLHRIQAGSKVSKHRLGHAKQPMMDKGKSLDARETTTRQVPQLTQPGGGSRLASSHIRSPHSYEAAGRLTLPPSPLHPTSVSTAGNCMGAGNSGNKLRK